MTGSFCFPICFYGFFFLVLGNRNWCILPQCCQFYYSMLLILFSQEKKWAFHSLVQANVFYQVSHYLVSGYRCFFFLTFPVQQVRHAVGRLCMPCCPATDFLYKGGVWYTHLVEICDRHYWHGYWTAWSKRVNRKQVKRDSLGNTENSTTMTTTTITTTMMLSTIVSIIVYRSSSITSPTRVANIVPKIHTITFAKVLKIAKRLIQSCWWGNCNHCASTQLSIVLCMRVYVCVYVVDVGGL